MAASTALSSRNCPPRPSRIATSKSESPRRKLSSSGPAPRLAEEGARHVRGPSAPFSYGLLRRPAGPCPARSWPARSCPGSGWARRSRCSTAPPRPPSGGAASRPWAGAPYRLPVGVGAQGAGQVGQPGDQPGAPPPPASPPGCPPWPGARGRSWSARRARAAAGSSQQAPGGRQHPLGRAHVGRERGQQARRRPCCGRAGVGSSSDLAGSPPGTPPAVTALPAKETKSAARPDSSSTSSGSVMPRAAARAFGPGRVDLAPDTSSVARFRRVPAVRQLRPDARRR